jgi:Rrf2 family protein
MLFTKASEYALMALITICKQEKAVDVLTLSANLKLSRSFLAKVLQSLAKAGILTSKKGSGGGFVLARPSDRIMIGELLHAVDNHCGAVFTCSSTLTKCPSGKSSICAVWPFLNRLQNKIDAVLETTSLADITQD